MGKHMAACMGIGDRSIEFGERSPREFAGSLIGGEIAADLQHSARRAV
jgi:hypothetical protein